MFKSIFDTIGTIAMIIVFGLLMLKFFFPA